MTRARRARPRPIRSLAPFRGVLAALLALVAGSGVFGAEVSFEVTSRETWVGAPVELRVTVRNAEEYSEPIAPIVRGARVESARPSTSVAATIINGQMSEQRTTVYTFRITPLEPGEIAVPPITVEADGQSFSSEAFRITARPSANDARLIVDVVADDDQVYVGERVDLTMRIYIRQYYDERLRIELNASDMWSRLDPARCRWGIFQSAIRRISERNQVPRGRSATPPGVEEGDGSYNLYEIPLSYWPLRSGPLDLGDVVIAMNYPRRLEVERRILGRTLSVAESRPISAEVDSSPVEVVALPSAGQPADFRGAVGRFDLAASIDPDVASVGEPMTLTLAIADRTVGGADLAALPAPPLATNDALTGDFKVSTDPLAGERVGDRKVFRQTIRPLRADVTEVPSISFSYFDPQDGSYVTRRTKPIPIEVRPSAQLSMSDVVGAEPTGGGAAATRLDEVQGGLLANHAIDPDRLRDDGVRLGPSAATVLILPPLAFVGVVALRARRERHRLDPGLGRRAGARRRALDGVRRATDAAGLRAAVAGFVSDALGLPPGTTTRADAVAAVTEAGLDAERTAVLSTLLQRCETLEYAGGSGLEESLRRDASEWIGGVTLPPRRRARGVDAA